MAPGHTPTTPKNIDMNIEPSARFGTVVISVQRFGSDVFVFSCLRVTVNMPVKRWFSLGL